MTDQPTSEIKGNADRFPLVSIGIPTYNGSAFIELAVQSVLKQDYEPKEILISDDCSTDNTAQVCEQLCMTHPGIKYFRQPKNIGLVRNFDFVLQHASGDLFMWVAHDDTLEPGILKKYTQFLAHHPEYSLVSGQIRYWSDNKHVFYEKDLSLEQSSPSMRVLLYYSKVVHGAMYYGLQRGTTGRVIPLRNRIGDDWHFVANLAYLGRIKNLDCVGYNKKLGGTSKNFKHYATVIGATPFAAKFPRVRIALDAFSEILFQSPVYKTLNAPSRFFLATACCTSILMKYYLVAYPFVIGGKLKRLFSRLLQS